MRLVEIPEGAVGIDCLEPLSAADLDALATYVIPGTRTGITFRAGYLEVTTPGELALTLASGFGYLPIGEGRIFTSSPPTKQSGQVDGLREMTRVRALGLPPGVGILCDTEAMGSDAVAAADYCRGWCSSVQPSGALAYQYVGAGVPLSPSELYDLPFTGYVRSLSNVQPVAVVDYFAVQAYPTTKLVLSTRTIPVDLIFVQRDKKSRAPLMVIG